MKKAAILISLATFVLYSCDKIDTTKCLPPPPPLITGPVTVKVDSTITLSVDDAGGTWSSSNTSKATINSTGAVKGVSVGAVSITYTTADGGCGSVKSYYAVTVTN